MKNIINFFYSKREIDDRNCKKYYRTGEFYKYEVIIQEKLIELNNLKNETSNMLYQNEIQNILIKFYNAVFNVCDKLAIEIHNGIFSNKDGFLIFFEFLSQTYLDMIDLSKQKDYTVKREEMIKISDTIKKELKPTVNDYVNVRDSIDSYIRKLTEIFNNTKNEKEIEFSLSEQYNILSKFYEKIIEIARNMKDEIENGIGINTGTMYFIMMELEKIINDLPDTSNLININDDSKIMEYKSSNKKDD